MPEQKTFFDPKSIDDRLFHTIFAEVGDGDPMEVQAVANVFLNRTAKEGYEKALKGSSAYNKKSRQYQLSASGKLNPYEKTIFERNKRIIANMLANPALIEPNLYYFENVKAFGEPKWSKGLKFKDIGRQRFYYAK